MNTLKAIKIITSIMPALIKIVIDIEQSLRDGKLDKQEVESLALKIGKTLISIIEDQSRSKK